MKMLNFDEPEATMYLVRGDLTHKGNKYTFWYEYDYRDGSTTYEVEDADHNWIDLTDLVGDKDTDVFENTCQGEIDGYIARHSL